LILVTIWVFLKTLFGESFESFFEKWGGWFVTAAFVLLFFIIVLTVQILKKFNEPEPTLSEPEKEKAES
jgi:purine-cytosine permease-like protein